MSAISEAAKLYLTRKVVLGNDIVTYRVLSRELSIHVNEAKQWLENFLDESRTTNNSIHAVYAVSGDALPDPYHLSQDEDEGSGTSQHLLTSSPSLASARQIVLTPETDLEDCKAQFLNVTSVHVYSLSSSSVTNPSLLVTTSEIVREKDSAAKSAPDHAKLVGMTLNPNWNEKLLPMKKGKALMPPPPPPPLSAAASGDSKVKEKTKTKDPKPKPGTLDWGKARVKTKEEPKPDKEDTKTELRGKKRSADDSDENTKTAKPAVKAKLEASSSKSSTSTSKPSSFSLPTAKSRASPDALKRATTAKPPTPIPVDENSSPHLTPTPLAPKPSASTSTSIAVSGNLSYSNVRLKKRVMMSDSEADDDDDGSQHRPLSKKARSSTASSVAVNLSDNDESDGVRKPIRTTATTVTKQRLTKSTRAMIDSDDEEEVPIEAHSNSESEPEHVPLSEREARKTIGGASSQRKLLDHGIDAAAKKEKREKVKAAKKAGGLVGKTVPKGKKKVLKERTYTNEKGRTVTEDYWTLESASDVGEDADSSEDKGKSKAKSNVEAPKPAGGNDTKTKLKPRASATAPSKSNSQGDMAAEKPSNVVAKTASGAGAAVKKGGQRTLAGFFSK